MDDSNMKLSIALLVLTVSTVTSYWLPLPRRSRTQLFYVDESMGMGKGMDPLKADAGTAAKPVVPSNDNDQLWMESLAFSLGLNDKLLEDSYNSWAARYGKKTTAFRFLQWKRNFLLQEVWNSANGQEFDLNENGDLTKLEFEAAIIQPCQIHEGQGLQGSHRHAYWEEGAAGDAYPKDKSQRFRQLRTFSGGFRLVEVSNHGTPRHGAEVKSIPLNHSPTKPTGTAASCPSESRQQPQPKPKRGGFMRAGLLRDLAPR